MSVNNEWKVERIRSIKESLEFFSNKNKLEREKWVVTRLLEQFIPDFNEGLLFEAEEPADVRYESANFQVKEILEQDRRRGDEYKQDLEKAEAAEEYSNLLSGYKPRDLLLSEIVDACYEYSKKLCRKYGPKERKSIDLVIYFNYLDSNEILTSSFNICSQEFRSFSVVSNRFRLVVYANENTPDFLQGQVGAVQDILRK